MNINNNLQKFNFKGYKNLITYDNSLENNRFTFVAMQLNNQGQNDLDSLKELKQYSLLFPKADVQGDTVMFLHTSSPLSSCTFLNGNTLYSEDELAILSKKLPFGVFKEIETPTLKAYDFCAKMTKSILDAKNYCSVDNDMAKVFKHSINVLTEISEGSSQAAMSLVEDALRRLAPPQKAASVINYRIHEAMKKYFHI